MLTQLKKTFTHSAIYGLGNMATKLIGLILLPLYTDYLSVSEYGILSIFEITSNILITILSVQMATSMMRWYSQEEDSKRKKSIILNSYFSSFIIQAIFISTAIWFTKDFSSILFGHSKFEQYFFYLIFWVSLEVINRISFSLLRINERSVFYIINVIIKFTSILGFNIYYVAYKQIGIEGIILSQVLGNLLVMGILLPYAIRKSWGGKPNFIIFKEMASFGAPLIFSSVGMLIYTMSDRYLLKYLASDYHVGIYSLGYKISSVINIVILKSLQLGFLPIAYKIYNKKGAKEFFAKIQTYIVFIIFIIGIPIGLFSKELIILFSSNPDYNIAYVIVPFLIVTFALLGVRFMLHLGLHFTKKTKYHAFITLVAAIVNILVNLLLIPYIHYWGAAITSIVSALVLVALFYKYSQKFYPVNYEKNRIFILFVLSIIIMGSGLLLNLFFGYFWINISIKILLWFSFPVILFLIGFFNKREIEVLKGFWRKWNKPKELLANFKSISKISD